MTGIRMFSIEPIIHDGVETLSFCQIDHLNRLPKGTAFRLFKAHRQTLAEGRDYFYLPASSDARLIESLKTTGQIYPATVNLVLFTRPGYERLRRYTGAPGSGT